MAFLGGIIFNNYNYSFSSFAKLGTWYSTWGKFSCISQCGSVIRRCHLKQRTTLSMDSIDAPFVLRCDLHSMLQSLRVAGDQFIAKWRVMIELRIVSTALQWVQWELSIVCTRWMNVDGHMASRRHNSSASVLVSRLAATRRLLHCSNESSKKTRSVQPLQPLLYWTTTWLDTVVSVPQWRH